MAQGKQKFKAQRPGGAKKQPHKPIGLRKGGTNHRVVEQLSVLNAKQR